MIFPLQYRLSGDSLSSACICAEIGTLNRNIAGFRQPIRIGAVLVQRSFQLLGRESLLNEFFNEIRDLIRKESEPVASESLTQKRDRLLRHRENLATVIRRCQGVFDEVAAVCR